jgi:hypothetical protein
LRQASTAAWASSTEAKGAVDVEQLQLQQVQLIVERRGLRLVNGRDPDTAYS